MTLTLWLEGMKFRPNKHKIRDFGYPGDYFEYVSWYYRPQEGDDGDTRVGV